MSEILYGISNSDDQIPSQNRIYQIDPVTGAIFNSQQIMLQGFTVRRALALDARPSDNVFFAVLQVTEGPPPGSRRLVTIDPNTGSATDIGPLSDAISSIAFDPSDDTLYGVVGTGGISPGGLFQINQLTGAFLGPFFFQLTAISPSNPPELLDGHVIAFNDSDGLLYHSTGTTGIDGGALLEKLDLNTLTLTTYAQIPNNVEATSMGYSLSTGQMYLSDLNNFLYIVDLSNGIRNPVTPLDLSVAFGLNRGLVFLPFTPICIHPEMLVSLQDGSKKLIKDVQVGDILMTANPNRPAKVVLNYRNKDTHKTLVRIETNTFNVGVPSEPLLITTNHPIVVDGKYQKPRHLINGNTIRKIKEPTNTYTIVTNTGKAVLVNNIPVATWTLKKFNEMFQQQ
jgi:hypothetical protein